MCCSLFNKVGGLKASNFIKKGFNRVAFPVNILKFLRPPALENTSWRLLLQLSKFPKIS